MDETVNFWNFRTLFMNKFTVIFMSFWHPMYKSEKRSNKANEAGCMQWPSLILVESLWSYKKTVVIKMNKMLYF